VQEVCGWGAWVDVVAGLRVTTPMRTAVDLAATRPLPDALMALDTVARRAALEHYTIWDIRLGLSHELTREVVRHFRELAAAVIPGRYRAQVARCLAVVDARHESALESLSAGQILLAGLRPPVPQLLVPTRLGEMFVDFGWAEEGVAGEADGMAKYQQPADLAAEKNREFAVEEAGLHVVRWGWAQMFGAEPPAITCLGRRLAVGRV
jgi:hypothetical protein